MDPKKDRVPEPDEAETIDDSDVIEVEDDEAAPDTIPPEGIHTTASIPPGDPEIEQVLLEERVDELFDVVRLQSYPPAPYIPCEPPAQVPVDPDEDPDEEFYKQFEKP